MNRRRMSISKPLRSVLFIRCWANLDFEEAGKQSSHALKPSFERTDVHCGLDTAHEHSYDEGSFQQEGALGIFCSNYFFTNEKSKDQTRK